MKKLFIGFFALVVIGIGVLLAIPYFITLDQFRPQIKAQIEKQVRGEVELGPLSLKLFPKVSVQAKGFKVIAPAPFAGEPVVAASEVVFEMPLYALLVAPKATLRIVGVELRVLSRGNQSIITAIMPPPAPDAASGTLPVPPTGAAGEAAAAPAQALGDLLQGLPGFLSARILAARFDFSLENSSVLLRDLAGPKDEMIELRALNFRLGGIGLKTPMQVLFDTEIAGNMAGAQIGGSISNTGTVTFSPEGKVNVVDIDLKQELNKLDLRYQPFFHKAAGLPFGTNLKGQIRQSPQQIEVNLSQLGLVFGQVVVNGNLRVVTVADLPESGTFETSFKLADFDVGSFGAMVPLIRDFKLAGGISGDIQASGKLLDPKLNMLIQLKGLTGSTPELQKPVSNLNGTVKIGGSLKKAVLRVAPFSMNIGSSDLSAELDVEGLKTFAVKAKASSKLLNVDELLGLNPADFKAPPVAEVAKAAASGKGDAGAAQQAAAPAAAMPLDDALAAMAPMVEELLKNDALDLATFQGQLQIGEMKAVGASFKNIKGEATYSNRKFNVNKAGLEAYGGSVVASMGLDLAKNGFGYSMNAGLNGVQMGQLTRIHAPEWEKEISGAMFGDFQVSGLGLRKEQLEKNLRGSVGGELRGGRISIPVIKLVGSTLDSLPKIGGQAVSLPEKQKNSRFDGGFKTAVFRAGIVGRRIDLQNLDVEYDNGGNPSNQLRFQANGTVTFDRQVELLGTVFLSPDLVRVAQWKGKSGMVEIPLKLAGDMSEPKPDYAYTGKVLGDRLIGNLRAEAEAKAREAAKREAEKAAKAAADKAAQAIKEKVPEPVKQKVDEVKDQLKKKFKL